MMTFRNFIKNSCLNICPLDPRDLSLRFEVADLMHESEHANLLTAHRKPLTLAFCSASDPRDVKVDIGSE